MCVEVTRGADVVKLFRGAGLVTILLPVAHTECRTALATVYSIQPSNHKNLQYNIYNFSFIFAR